MANFTTTAGGTVTGSLQVQAVANDVLVEVVDNNSNLVAGPYVVLAGNTNLVNFSFAASTTQHQIRITNTTTPGNYNDFIYVTAFNVWENILVPDNYTITQLTVKETQYIAVPDVFNVSNLSVTATPYPDVAHVHQLYVSYAKPYTRPLCANNNDKLEGVNKYRFGFNGKELDNEVSGSGNSYDYGFRIYNPRLGRWLSLDPLQFKFPFLSPYNYCANNPIIFIDPDGRIIEGVTIQDGKYVYTEAALKNGTDKYIEARTKTQSGQTAINDLIASPETYKISVTPSVILMPTGDGRYAIAGGGADPSTNSLVVGTNEARYNTVTDEELKSAVTIDENGNVIPLSINRDQLDNPLVDPKNKYAKEYKKAYKDSGAEEFDKDPNNAPKSQQEKINGFGAHEETHLKKENQKKSVYAKEKEAFEQEVKERKEYQNTVPQD